MEVGVECVPIGVVVVVKQLEQLVKVDVVRNKMLEWIILTIYVIVYIAVWVVPHYTINGGKNYE